MNNNSTKKSIYESLMRDISKIVMKRINEASEYLAEDDEETGTNPAVKVGDTIRIIRMEGEPQYTGATGEVDYIDSLGQLHGTWGGLAVQPENDEYELI